LRNPIIGFCEVCAFAASGQTTEPTMTLMKSRRRIVRFQDSRQFILSDHEIRLKAASLRNLPIWQAPAGWNQSIFMPYGPQSTWSITMLLRFLRLFVCAVAVI